jgi:hypothetical protein
MYLGTYRRRRPRSSRPFNRVLSGRLEFHDPIQHQPPLRSYRSPQPTVSSSEARTLDPRAAQPWHPTVMHAAWISASGSQRQGLNVRVSTSGSQYQDLSIRVSCQDLNIKISAPGSQRQDLSSRISAAESQQQNLSSRISASGIAGTPASNPFTLRSHRGIALTKAWEPLRIYFEFAARHLLYTRQPSLYRNWRDSNESRCSTLR